MERIHKALEKARRERERRQAQRDVVSLHGQGAYQAPTPETPPPVEPQDVAPENITYTDTQVVPVSAEVLERNRIVAAIPGHPHADVFRVLRTRVLQRMQKQGYRSLAVTSPGKGAGKSLIAANLAVALAAEGNHTVLLVDMDLRRPRMHRCFGLSDVPGLSDLLMGEAELPGLLVNPGIGRLVLLPAGQPVLQPSDLLSTRRMRALIREITERYTDRLLVFDMPPLLGMDDALAVSPDIHASLLVVDEGGTTREELEQSLELLGKEHFLGVVYNKARDHAAASY